MIKYEDEDIRWMEDFHQITLEHAKHPQEHLTRVEKKYPYRKQVVRNIPEMTKEIKYEILDIIKITYYSVPEAFLDKHYDKELAAMFIFNVTLIDNEFVGQYKVNQEWFDIDQTRRIVKLKAFL